MYKPVDKEYIIGRELASDNIFDNKDHHHEHLKIDSYDDDHSSNTAEHSLTEYASGFDEGDFDLEYAGNEAISPSSKDVTKGAALSLIFALLVKHRLSDFSAKGCLGDHLQLLNIVFPNCVPISSTKYSFQTR